MSLTFASSVGAFLSKNSQISYPLTVSSVANLLISLSRITSCTSRDPHISRREKISLRNESSFETISSNAHHNCKGIQGSNLRSSLNNKFVINLVLLINSICCKDDINWDMTSLLFSFKEI